jgi:nicotinate-nucleotide pyrophosphorylase (carboxylating)
MKKELLKIIQNALEEDNALNDATSDNVVDKNHEISFSISPRNDIILCGIDVAQLTFSALKESSKFQDAKIDFSLNFKDGDLVQKGQKIISGNGNARLIFAAERVILNLMQHLSGVATTTKQFVDALNDDNIQILDTRKTTPNLRILEKYAVLKGGGKNHRFDLSDMILIKDNHIASCENITEAILKARQSKLKVEVECDNLNQVKQALKANPDIIMLDNMTIEQIKEAKEIIKNSCKIEVSGGINLSNIANYKGIGVDFISSGAITHSATSIDLGLDVE